MLLFLLLFLLPIEDFERPLAEFGKGHRGIDLALNEVKAPTDGVVSFSGKVFTRNLITVETPDGKFSFEPVCSALKPGDQVVAGQILGSRCETEKYESHCTDCVHVSFRDPEYRNPLWVLGLREPSRGVSGPGVGLRITLSESFD
jgi:hypothetical protein